MSNDDPQFISAKSHFIGPYKIIQEIGAGGMGKVFKALHSKLNKIVAIKVMTESNPRRKQRFLIEARLTAQLKHPNIVTIYDVGSQGDLDYIVMDYIEGQSLFDYLKKNKLSPRKATKIMKDIVWAIEYAHRMGVIHRDLKPGNIIMEKETGRPLVVDFGLAKDIKSSKEMTQSGELLGTPKYMAPEQMEGRSGKITPLVDIYSLGSIYYEMLTGVPIVTGNTPAAVMFNILHKEVTPLRQINSRIAKDLEIICLKAVAKEKELRYQSCRVFAEDLEAFLNGENISASPLNFTQKTKRLVKKQSKVIITVTITTSVFLCLLLLVLSQKNSNSEKEQLATQEQEMMKKIEEEKRLAQEEIDRKRIIAEKTQQELKKQKEEAEKAQQKLLIQQQVEAHLSLAKSYQDLGKWKEANIEYTKATELVPDNPIIHYYNGMALFFLKEHSLAIDSYSTAINLKPDYKEAYLSRAYCYGLIGKIAEGMKDLDTAVEVAPDYVEGYFYRGLGYEHQGKLELAIKDFDTALSLNPKRTDIVLRRGIVFVSMGKDDLAEKNLLEVLSRDPNDLAAQKFIAGLYQKQKKHEKAVFYYKQYIRHEKVKADEKADILVYINRWDK